MSRNVINNKHFLALILSTTKEQALALLNTITKDQILLLSEIAKNILELPLPTKARHYVSKKKRLIERIANKTLSHSKKVTLLKKNAKYILQLLLAIKLQLIELQ